MFDQFFCGCWCAHFSARIPPLSVSEYHLSFLEISYAILSYAIPALSYAPPSPPFSLTPSLLYLTPLSSLLHPSLTLIPPLLRLPCPLSYAHPFSLTPFSLRPAPPLLRLPCPLLRLSLLSYAFPALSYAPPFSLMPFSYAHPFSLTPFPALSYAPPFSLMPFSPSLSHLPCPLLHHSLSLLRPSLTPHLALLFPCCSGFARAPRQVDGGASGRGHACHAAQGPPPGPLLRGARKCPGGSTHCVSLGCESLGRRDVKRRRAACIV